MRHTIGIAAIVAVVTLVSCGPTLARDLNLAGGLMLTGETITYTVGGSVQVVKTPAVYLDLLYSPEVGEAALGLSAPVRVALDPLAKLCGFEWAPWAESAMDRVNVGLAGWRTQEKFPVTGGLYFKVTALEWGF